MAKIERDASGKTRVAKGDKSGLGGQFAPDPALLKKYAEQSQQFAKAQSRYATPEERDSLSVKEYEEALLAREALQDYYTAYNKEQQEIANSVDKEEVVSDGTFVYHADFCYDVPYNVGMSRPNSDDGQPRGWMLRVGTRGNSAPTGTGFYATREEALASLEQVQQSRKNNAYVQEQVNQYDPQREREEAVELDRSAPLGPWTMELKFIEPEPNINKPKENGYHAGWCIVAKSPEYGTDVFIEHQGYRTREEAAQVAGTKADAMKAWEGKYRSVHVDGVGSVLYNDMSHENYQKLISSYGFTPQPWLAYDQMTDYYPKSNYPGD